MYTWDLSQPNMAVKQCINNTANVIRFAILFHDTFLWLYYVLLLLYPGVYHLGRRQFRNRKYGQSLNITRISKGLNFKSNPTIYFSLLFSVSLNCHCILHCFHIIRTSVINNIYLWFVFKGYSRLRKQVHNIKT